MVHFWTCHWQNRFWRDDVNTENTPCCSSGSNSFGKRGVSVGDVAYIISLAEGQLLLGGRMAVKRIVSRNEAVRIFHNENFYDAEEWIIDEEKTGTLLNLHRRLAPEVTKQLRFLRKSGPKPLCFKTDTHLDAQATRGVHRLTEESAGLLDQVIEITDRLPRSKDLVTVTQELLRGTPSQDDEDSVRLPEEIPTGSAFSEGSVEQILVNKYERDPRAKEDCKKHYGTRCALCGFDFVDVYGAVMADFIHVHHVKPLSTVGAGYKVDPVDDLRPVCPNCHAVLHHRREPPYSLDEVRRFIESRKLVLEAESRGP